MSDSKNGSDDSNVDSANRLVLVDTNIWQFAFVKPRESEFVQIHELAKSFLSGLLDDNRVRIAASAYQVAEIMEVLRKSGADEETRNQVRLDLGTTKFYVRDLSLNDVVKAAIDSSKSSIHIYDYLIAYPLRGIITRIYSADGHFKHPDLSSVAEVVNPLAPWRVTEGKRPERENGEKKRKVDEVGGRSHSARSRKVIKSNHNLLIL